MSVNPLDRTDHRLIQLVAELGDPLVETQTLAEEVSRGFQETQARLSTLEEQGWVIGQPGDGQRRWQVSSKAGLLVRTDSAAPDDTDAGDIIEAEDEPDSSADTAGETDRADDAEKGDGTADGGDDTSDEADGTADEGSADA